VTVSETGTSPGTEGGSKLDTDPATLSPLDRDVVQISAIGSGNGNGNGNGNSQGESDQVLTIDDQVLLTSLPGHKHTNSTTDALDDTGSDGAGS
jgi:hypothetical protein